MEIALALVATLALGWWLGRRRRRRRRRGLVEEAGGFLAGGVPAVLAHEQLQRDLEDGTLDPDELDGEPLDWDEGADDEVD